MREPAKRGGIILAQHARVEHVHAVAGLFSALPRRKRPRREVAYDVSDVETWRFREFEALGADDQTVFLTILAMIAQSRQSLGADEATRVLALRGESRVRQSLYLVTSARRLASECGWPPRWRLIQQSLTRLSSTTFDIVVGGVTRSAGALLARLVRDDGQLVITINPHLARVLLDPDHTLWARVDLDERRQLTTDTARVLHAWLCAWLRPGQSGSVQVTTLVSHVWPDEGAPPAGTVKFRHHAVREALHQIGSLAGWSIGAPNAHGAMRVSRAGDVHTRQSGAG